MSKEIFPLSQRKHLESICIQTSVCFHAAKAGDTAPEQAAGTQHCSPQSIASQRWEP
jgi:hypothetical protein